MKLKNLTPNAKNPRTISDAKLKQLKKALTEFGDLGGIVFNRKSQQLVGGHQRTKLFDPDTTIVVTRKYPRPTKTGTVAEGYVESKAGERFAYREVFWDDHREKAANIAANKGAGEWDLPQLGEWLKELSSFDLDFDMDLTMHDEDEIAAITGDIIVRGHTRVGATGVDEDEVPEKAPARTKLGDVYTLGGHRLMCGDSMSDPQILKLMKGKRADLVFTDPPYGMNFRSNARTEKFRSIENDDVVLDVAPVLWELMAETAVAYVCTRWDLYPQWFDQFKKFNVKNCIVWSKGGGGMGDLENAYAPTHEFIIVAHKGAVALREKRCADVWSIGKDGATEYKHPTQKPVALSEFAIENHSDVAALVVDLFGGSGSTLIACEKTHRKCFMMELDPHYCDVIVERWEKYTGQTAVLERTETKTRKRATQVNEHVNG